MASSDGVIHSFIHYTSSYIAHERRLVEGLKVLGERLKGFVAARLVSLNVLVPLPLLRYVIIAKDIVRERGTKHLLQA
jgi:tetrahydromethanopterin S-methyltransferase subunit F